LQLKEKEQLHRISTYKLNELKRNVKHKQLKPLGSKAGDTSEASQKGKA